MSKQANPVSVFPPVDRERTDRSQGNRRPILQLIGFVGVLAGLAGATTAWAGDDIDIDRANWSSDRDRLTVRGDNAPDNALVTIRYGEKDKNGAVIGTTEADGDGDWEFRITNLNPVPCDVTAQAGGDDDDKEVRRAPSNCSNDGGGQPPPPVEPPPPVLSGNYSILAANDLGMHCADLDYQIFSILPPFNVVHAQVVQKGTGSTKPRILTDTDVDVVYSPVEDETGSINTTNDSTYLGFEKTNFWKELDPINPTQTIGGAAYRVLYPSTGALDLPPSDPNFCDPSIGPCPSALDLFEPMVVDTGLPVPDPLHLPGIVTGQQHMPGPDLTPQHFDRFDADLSFFAGFPFEIEVTGANWFAADGIPILPIDDAGNENAYPLMRVEAITKGSDPATLASVDVVLPVASEADCHICHAASDDLVLFDLGMVSNGAATDIRADDPNDPDAPPSFSIQHAQDAPGDTALNKLQNAAKINILRLHDAKHGAWYKSWDSTDAEAALGATPCNPSDVETFNNCLANQTPVQCSQCHYSPALDLAQAGPVDEPEQGPRGRQQLHHISQSRAMHGHHGSLNIDDTVPQPVPVFPTMPGPQDFMRDEMAVKHFPEAVDPLQTVEEYVLEATCYACHPGKRTQCLRGAMANAGIVCQDCHGDMVQVGNDFTEQFPITAGDMSGGVRVPWASEPGCQSCHVGDAVDQPEDTEGFIYADDNIRLLQAYRDGDADAMPIKASDSRFAENQSLYRLSQGHGGVKCEGCHGSTHAVWPNANPSANDNVAAKQIQGHTGTITECSVCHENNLGLTMDGPHGMHPVASEAWNKDHKKEMENGNNTACKTCHGTDGLGTVLSRTATKRTWECKNEDGTLCNNGDDVVIVPKGTVVGCDQCHENEINHR